MILILNHLRKDDFDFDLKSFLYKVILILIWNHFTSDFTHHWKSRKKNLRIFVVGGAYAPDAPCLATPLLVSTAAIMHSNNH